VSPKQIGHNILIKGTFDTWNGYSISKKQIAITKNERIWNEIIIHIP
jgi:hypothetical protein